VDAEAKKEQKTAYFYAFYPQMSVTSPRKNRANELLTKKDKKRAGDWLLAL